MPTAYVAADRVWANHVINASSNSAITISERYTEQVDELRKEVEELKSILRKISDKLQNDDEFDDELKKLLFSI